MILSADSGFFNCLTDSSFQEGQTSSVPLPKDEPELIARMLIFAYFSTYPVTSISDKPFSQFKAVQDRHSTTRNSELDCVARAKLQMHMYALADKYDLPALKAQSRQRFLISFYEQDEYTLDYERGPDENNWAVNADIIGLVYTATPWTDRGLRDIVLEFYVRIAQNGAGYTRALASPAVRTPVAQSVDLATGIALNTLSTVCYKCEICAEVDSRGLSSLCDCGKVDSCTQKSLRT